MRQATALKVADLLASVECWLEGGRPRKRPGKPRVDAEDIYGKPVERLTPKQAKEEGIFSKLSLPAAFRLAAASQGYSRYTRKEAEAVVAFTAWCHGWEYVNVEELDEYCADTREIIRYVRSARLELQKQFGI